MPLKVYRQTFGGTFFRKNSPAMQQTATRLRYIGRMGHDITYNEMVLGCRGGKRAAQTAFYGLFAKELFTTAVRLLNDTAAAEEVMQDVLLRVLTDTSLLLLDHAAMERRLKRMTINAAIDHLRKARRIQWEAWDEHLEPCEDETEELLYLEEQTERLRRAIEALPTQSRAVLQLAVLEEMPLSDVASILQIKASSVRAHLTRAKQRLITWFKNERK